MKSSLRKLRGFALQRHEQRVDRDRGRNHSTAAVAAAEELLAAAQVRCSPLLVTLSLRGVASESVLGRWEEILCRMSCLASGFCSSMREPWRVGFPR